MFSLLRWEKTGKGAGERVEFRKQSEKEVVGRKDQELGIEFSVLGNLVFYFHFLFSSFGRFGVEEDLRHSDF